MVADGHARHAVTDRLDDAGALVPEHCRTARGRRPVDRVLIRVANTARVDPDEHLVPCGRRKLGPICEQEEPPLAEVEPEYFLRCHISVDELRQLQAASPAQ